jgi:hypothetical protein
MQDFYTLTQKRMHKTLGGRFAGVVTDPTLTY